VRALIIAAHGSRKKDSALEVAALAKKIEDKLDPQKGLFDRVTHAFLQFAEPELGDVIEKTVASGADQVVVFPFFIATGSHVLTDIPELVDKASKAHPHVEFSISRHLGVIPAIEDLILGEMADHLSQSGD
jgi:sirohydrochlorin cobaltochelatase